MLTRTGGIMERILVLGGATGLLGQAIVEEINANEEWSVTTLGRTDGDIFDPAFISKAIKSIAPKIIFNTIAYTQVDLAEDHAKEAQNVNAVFPEILAHIVKQLDCHLVHFSTDYVFSGNEQFAKSESALTKPESVYGETKLRGEEILTKLIPTKSTICRSAWLFGPHRKNFIETICKAGKKIGKLKVVADQVGSPTYTRDLAKCSIALAKQRMHGLWHVANSGQASWYDLAVYALNALNISCLVTPISTSEWPQKAKRPAYSVLNTTKLSNFLGTQLRTWQEAVDCYAKEIVL